MKPHSITSLSMAVAALAAPVLSIAQTVSTEAFLSPSSFTLVSSVNDLHVSELASVSSAASTHILIEGLVPVTSGSNVVTSSYRGINLESGDTTEVGSMIFTLPNNANLSGATSPIVGIVARNGSWDDFSPVVPDVALGNASGAASIGASSVTINLAQGGSTYTGSADFTVLSEQSVELADFSVSDGATTISFHGTTLNLFNGEFYGVIQAVAPAGVNSTLLAIRFAGLPDSDGDGIPDWSDADGSTGAGVILDAWAFTPSMDWVYGRTDEWAFSTVYGFVYYSSYPWLYIPKVGWAYFALRVSTESEQAIWLYTVNQGFIYVPTANGGWFNIRATNTWNHFTADVPQG